MRDIKHLPEAVRSSVRSGIVFFDLTRVVEELIFNSLDAGATKVSVAVGAGTCYIKVVDNGCGITRDGLVLVGERYATSKFDQLADTDAATGSFGFRGEALSSISDVSLLEVITKAHGRPNGYHKVMKGCKCLYLGIDDGRQDVGTTVIVRDLFYNQPVRRKHIQSSPKKVLQSVKKCVFRIALVHPKVFFKVVDIESEDELFCTTSSSPLSLLASGFGFEVSGSLHELSVSDGVLKLSGYVSSHCNTSSLKAFQFVYINSRCICKGPIHKLLNQLAARFNSLDLHKANIELPNGKQSRSQTYATYILNLSCPRSWYDITFEPSKTSVEFKDWFPIINFIEKVITRFWSENVSYGNPSSHGTNMSGEDNMWREDDNVSSPEEDMPVKYEIAKRKRRNHHASFGLHSPQLETLTEEHDLMSHWKGNTFSCQNASEYQTRLGSVYQTDYSFQSCDGLRAPSGVTVNRESGSYLQATDNNIFSADDHFWGNKFFVAERSNEHADDILGSRLQDAHLIDAGISNGFIGSALSCDCFEIGEDVYKVSKDLKKPFLQSCSSRRSLPLDGPSFASSEAFDFQIDGFRTKRKRLEPSDGVAVAEVHDISQRFDLPPRTLWKDEVASAWSSSRPLPKCDMLMGLDFLSRGSVKSSAIGGECFAGENNLPPDSVVHIGKFGSSHQSFKSEWSPVMSDPVFGTKSQDVDHFVDENTLERSIKYHNISRYEYLADEEVKDHGFYFDGTMRNSSSQENCSSSSFANMCSGFESCARSKEDNCGFIRRHNLDDVLFPKCSDRFSDEREWLCLDSCSKYNTNNCAVTSQHISSEIYCDMEENQKDPIIYQAKSHVCKREPKRSHSAPPFYRGKKKFFALSNHLTMEAGKPKAQAIDNTSTSQGTCELKHPQQISGVCKLHSESNSVEDSLVYTRPDKKKAQDLTDIQKCETQKSEGLYICSKDSVEDFTLKEIQDPLGSGLKWRKSCPQTADGDKLHSLHNENTVLDVSSGILHLAGDSLVPESINKNCLEDAKVLQQVDKKFIPIVGGGVLSVIDQHAADERIRLEELRQKVLSGEMKTIAYLDAEQKLVLPEIGYQLLHNYAEQVQNWGWICNIHALGSRSFKKSLNLLHRQSTVVTLTAVPCILGVNLTDVDLFEFLQQLADTDGSSTIPPSIHRVLNSKACRGAVMFGDTLLPSECSLIVEELKQTSLCFQCAHGRPTTVPLVNLEALHKQIAKLGLWNGGSNELWHGLHRHQLSLERAAQRLSSARGRC